MPLLQAISSDQEPVRAAENASGMRSHERGFGRYLLSTSMFLLVMYCVPFYVVRRADFDEISNTPYSLPLNSAFKMAGQNADVVVFGDSTALHGIDPSQMSRELGMKAINLPNTGATLRVMDDLSLRRYLATNRAPRLIVFYFAPWDLDYMHTELPIGTYEGREVLAHQGTGAEIFAYAWSHPSESLEFPFQFYMANSSWRAVVQRPYRYAGAEVARTQGHLSNPALTPLPEQCEFWPSATHDLRFDSVKALGTKYGTAETKILSFVAPIPACRNAAAVLNQPYNTLPAASPRELALSMFSGSVMYLHPTPEAVPAVTEQLVEAVRPMLGDARP
jgi:hypothetical protein